MRAIDADAMIDRLKKWDTKDKTDKALYNFTLSRINEQPTIQPEIVRCKDCSYYKNIKRTDRHQCVNDFVAVIETKSDDFCSKAERRTDDSRRKDEDCYKQLLQNRMLC